MRGLQRVIGIRREASLTEVAHPENLLNIQIRLEDQSYIHCRFNTSSTQANT